MSLAGRDIGELPDVADPARRTAAASSLRLFCESYFPNTFTLKWSGDHLTVIGKIERAVIEGGLFAMAMPRGSGKTCLIEAAAIWAMVYGHRSFVAIIGAEQGSTIEILDSIKSEVETNEHLLADFPEACYPIHRLEGITQRANGQLYHGERTRVGWRSDEIVMPSVRPSAEWCAVAGNRVALRPDGQSLASGAVVRVAGITGRIRGMKFKRPDGDAARPDLVLIDDPQTDESARSPSQCATRERILAGAVLGLAGPGRKIAGLMTVTVIQVGDMADRILYRDKHPEWQGERTKLLYALPTNARMWEQYAEARERGMRAGRGLADATEFYRANRVAMDDGAIPAWPERFNPDELSAVQHAINLRLERGDAAFFAEYQNDPIPETPEDVEMLTADQIAAKTNGHTRGSVSLSCEHLTAFIDVQKAALWWAVVGWESNFTGYVVDYGAWPDQGLEYYGMANLRKTLADIAPSAGVEGRIYAGLDSLAGHILTREWPRDGGVSMRIERCLIDANWGESTSVVYQFCRQSSHAAVLMPSHGVGVTASGKPFSDHVKKRGERVGDNWRMPVTTGTRAVRHVVYDTNAWKSFLHARLAVSMGDPGCLSLFGGEQHRHRMIADHLTAEYRVRTSGRGREVDEWKLADKSRDNHLFDCVVGAAVAADMCGVSLMGTPTASAKRERTKLSDLQRRR